METNQDIISPEEALARFRAGRVEESVNAIRPTVSEFDHQVNRSLDGTRPAHESTKSLTKAFVSAFRTFSEAQDAAKSAGIVTGVALDALGDVMTRLRAEFKAGLTAMNGSLDKMNSHSPGAFGEFCQAATDRLKRLEQFWNQTYEAAPKRPQMTMKG